MKASSFRYLPSLNIRPKFLEFFESQFARVILIKHGDHAAAHVFGKTFEGEFCKEICYEFQ